MWKHLKKHYWLWILFFLAMTMRIPAALFQELPPFQFCDEEIYSSEVFKMLTEMRLFTKEFRAGGMNIYPAYFLGLIYSYLKGHLPSLTELILLGRIFYNVILNSLTLFVLYFIAQELLPENRRFKFLLVSLFVLSPMVLGVSRIWYPDHYIIFFATYALLLFIKLARGQRTSSLLWQTGLAMALVISSKYTGLFLVIPYIFATFKDWQKNKDHKTHFIVFCSFVLSFCILQISGFVYPNEFKEGFLFNLKNYQRSETFNFNGIGFYSVILLVTSSGLLSAFLCSFGIICWHRLQKKITYLLLSFPVFLLLYLGKAGLVINRNMIIALPFLLPFFALGLEAILQKIDTATVKTKKKLIYATVFMLFFLEPAYKISTQIQTDLQIDSRVLARNWINQHLPANSIIVHNEFCSGESPAMSPPYQLIRLAELGNKKHDYFVFNSWWGGPFNTYLESYGLLVNPVYSSFHYLHINEKNWFSIKHHHSDYQALQENLNYQVIKEIKAAGPTILIAKSLRKIQ
ncbi:MAG: phospholipid carrier-dependent glycosyltransferase [Bdellovibrionaceae bacterium]|nr:phospholipid carrier-dependent glycosyltransferase [Pseudobdellovibrionaceae bacterium]